MRIAMLMVCGLLAPAAALDAAETAEPSAAAHLSEVLGLQPSSQAVRERPGWHTPHVILVAAALHDLVPQLQQVAPGVKILDISAATPRQVAAADATIGVCSAEILAAAKRLEWIQWLAVGVENCVNQPLLRERHPLLTNMQRAAAPSMAEHVIAMMLVLSRHLNYFMREQSQAHWAQEDAPQLEDLDGKTVLIVGLGGIGTEVAKRAHALGMKITATRASGHAGPDYISYVGLPDELLKLTKDADFIVNCLPLTPQTRGIFDRQFFLTMKPSAYFLSVGRAGRARSPRTSWQRSMATRSQAPPSTWSIRNRCPRTARCGGCRISSSHRTSRATRR
jgi:phosphoglycerate dehydrogenase-like enzyme